MGTGTAAAVAGAAVCQICGAQTETKKVELYQNIGMVVARRTNKISANLCRRCIREHFKAFSLTTLFLGWWGMISFILTPLILLNNAVRFLMSVSLPEPPPSLAASPATAYRPSAVGGSKNFKLVYGGVVGVVLLGFLAYNSVPFMEKVAPSLNASLHNGDISDGADAKYAGARLGHDIHELSAPIKSAGWAAIRTEYLAREPYFNDLKIQNGKLQQAFARERTEGALLDQCEKLALNQFGPAVAEYTNALDQRFTLIKNTQNAGDSELATLKDLDGREDAALNQMSASFSARKQNGCK